MKGSLILILIIAFNFYGFSQKPYINQSTLIGKLYKRVSDIKELSKFREEEGVVIEPSKNVYSFSKVFDNRTTLILLNENHPPAFRKILAILEIGPISSGQKLVMARCRQGNKPDDFIVAIVKRSNGDYFKQILKAWRVDAKNAKFINISTAGIDCLNDAEDATD